MKTPTKIATTAFAIVLAFKSSAGIAEEKNPQPDLTDSIDALSKILTPNMSSAELRTARWKLNFLMTDVDDIRQLQDIQNILPEVADEINEWRKDTSDNKTQYPDGPKIYRMQTKLGMKTEDKEGGFGPITADQLMDTITTAYKYRTRHLPKINLNEFALIEQHVKEVLGLTNNSYTHYQDYIGMQNNTLTDTSNELSKQLEAVQKTMIKACAYYGIDLEDTYGSFGRSLVSAIDNGENLSDTILNSCANKRETRELFPDGIPQEILDDVLNDQSVEYLINQTRAMITQEEAAKHFENFLKKNPEEAAKIVGEIYAPEDEHTVPDGDRSYDSLGTGNYSI